MNKGLKVMVLIVSIVLVLDFALIGVFSLINSCKEQGWQNFVFPPYSVEPDKEG